MATIAVHGHFYQPDRRSPSTGTVPLDLSAAPDHDWNARINRQCYRPNADEGNYGRISHDFGPTLQVWLERADPETYDRIISQGRNGNAIAQGWHHAILPLALPEDRRTEIRWGVADFEMRYGYRPAGFWLPETAVDTPTLVDLVDAGIKWVILAPWQAVGEVDTRRPYRVDLPGGRRIIVVFFDAALSALVSFAAQATENADRFVREFVGSRAADLPDGTEPLIVIASDGELYGHHQAFREKFLAGLPDACRRAGMRMRSLSEVLATVDVARLQSVQIGERTSWSCHHGVARWSEFCLCCTEGSWKAPLRDALNRLARNIDGISRRALARHGVDLARARDGYVAVASGMATPSDYAALLLGVHGRDKATLALVMDLLEAQRSRLAMFTSCAWFWDDPTRQETITVLAYAADAIARVRVNTGVDLAPGFMLNLVAVRSSESGEDGQRIYGRAVAQTLLRAA